MPAITILYPVTVKGLLITMTPWLAGSVIIGALVGRQSVENRRRNNIIARQQAAIEQLRTAQLQAQRPTRPILTTSTNTPARSTADHETKHSLLQRILENNLSLRQDIEQSTRDE